MKKFSFGSQYEDEDGNIIVNQKIYNPDTKNNVRFSLYSQENDILKGNSIIFRDSPVVNIQKPQKDIIETLPNNKNNNIALEPWKKFYKDETHIIKEPELKENIKEISLKDEVKNDIINFFEIPNYIKYGFAGMIIFIIYNDLIE
jgi:hypothetical protein